MIIFPVRHHSPAAALQVQRLIRERRPQAVLVEGPQDATGLIPLLLDPATMPPVALYAHRTDDEVRTAFWPLCAYSPEYAALQAGQEVGAQLQFCDLPAGVVLTGAAGRGENGAGAESPAAPGAGHEAAAEPPPTAPTYGDFTRSLAQAAGYEDFEEFWEAAFEQEAGGLPPAGYIELLADFGQKARSLTPADVQRPDDLREQQMAAAVRATVESGIPAESVMLVCGAAHAQAIAALLKAGAPAPSLPEPAPVAVSLIPYSYPRLSEQAGYGAGNRAPWFYRLVWERHGDYAAAARRALVEVAHRLRQEGRPASLAQAIDAYNLAAVLAQHRGKAGPGAAEVAEAAVACLGEGRPAVVSPALEAVLIGDAVGQVTPRVGRTPLQAEFYATAQKLRLPLHDAPRQVLLHLTDPREREQSVFLHRLAVAGIPFARELESGLGGGGRVAQADPLSQLGRVREKWELQWTPQTDAALVEQAAWGSTLTEVCTRRLHGKLAAASRIDAGTETLLQMALCDLMEGFSAGLDRCAALAADSADFAPLARATYHLDGLLNYGAARRLPAEPLTALTRDLFLRAALALPAAAICGDEDAAAVAASLTALYELVERRRPAAPDPEAFWRSVGQVAAMAPSHPRLRGLTLVMLNLSGRLDTGELAARLRYWLSTTTAAAANAQLVAGLFSLHRGTLVRNQELLAAVTNFLAGLSLEALTPLLPVLRSSLGNLSSAERAYLSETLAAVLGVTGAEAGQALRLSDVERRWLREADAAVAATLARWRERYGIA